MTSKFDQIYNTNREAAEKFRFNAEVADVFADMISRSVPGYQQILDLVPTLVRYKQYLEGNFYDLGCSLGAGMLALASGVRNPIQNTTPPSRTIIGIDSSQAMLTQAQTNLQADPELSDLFELRHERLQDSQLSEAAIVLMNFTLQFIPIAERQALLQDIFDNTVEGGILVLSEKLLYAEAMTDRALIDIHHQFKADQGYSQLEIAQKRDAIENVLLPETLDTHIARLRKVGYLVVTPWIQNLQFTSILAIK